MPACRECGGLIDYDPDMISGYSHFTRDGLFLPKDHKARPVPPGCLTVSDERQAGEWILRTYKCRYCLRSIKHISFAEGWMHLDANLAPCSNMWNPEPVPKGCIIVKDEVRHK